jgi:hypothetical protein
MPAVINGNDVGVYVGGTLIGCLTGASLTSTRTEIDVTCKDQNGDRAVILGGAVTDITFDGLFKPDASYGFEDLWDIYIAKTEVSLAYGDLTNLTIYTQAYLQTITWDGPLNAGSTFSGKFSGTGTLTKTET